MASFEAPWAHIEPRVSVAPLASGTTGALLALTSGEVDVNLWMTPGTLVGVVREAQAALAALPDEWRNYSGEREARPASRRPVPALDLDLEDVPF